MTKEELLAHPAFFTHIYDANLSERAKNTLQGAGFAYIGELYMVSDIFLLTVRTLGEKCFHEIEQKIIELGLPSRGEMGLANDRYMGSVPDNKIPYKHKERVQKIREDESYDLSERDRLTKFVGSLKISPNTTNPQDVRIIQARARFAAAVTKAALEKLTPEFVERAHGTPGFERALKTAAEKFAASLHTLLEKPAP